MLLPHTVAALLRADSSNYPLALHLQFTPCGAAAVLSLFHVNKQQSTNIEHNSRPSIITRPNMATETSTSLARRVFGLVELTEVRCEPKAGCNGTDNFSSTFYSNWTCGTSSKHSRRYGVSMRPSSVPTSYKKGLASYQILTLSSPRHYGSSQTASMASNLAIAMESSGSLQTHQASSPVDRRLPTFTCARIPTATAFENWDHVVALCCHASHHWNLSAWPSNVTSAAPSIKYKS